MAEDMGLREKNTDYVVLLGDGLLGWRFVTTVSWSCDVVPKDVREGGVVCILVEVMYRLCKGEARRDVVRGGLWRSVMSMGGCMVLRCILAPCSSRSK